MQSNFRGNCNLISEQKGNHFSNISIPPITKDDKDTGYDSNRSIITKLSFFISCAYPHNSIQVLGNITFCNYDSFTTQSSSSKSLDVNIGNRERCAGPMCNKNCDDSANIAPDSVTGLNGYGISGFDVYQTANNIWGFNFRFSHLYSPGSQQRKKDVFVTIGKPWAISVPSLCKIRYYPPSNKYFLNQLTFATSWSDDGSEWNDGLLRVTNTKWLNLTTLIDNYYDPVFIAKCCNNPFSIGTIESTICALLPIDTTGVTCANARTAAQAAKAITSGTTGSTTGTTGSTTGTTGSTTGTTGSTTGTTGSTTGTTGSTSPKTTTDSTTDSTDSTTDSTDSTTDFWNKYKWYIISSIVIIIICCCMSLGLIIFMKSDKKDAV